MNLLRAVMVLAVVSSGCHQERGDGLAKFRRMWLLQTGSMEWGDCTDDPSFRGLWSAPVVKTAAGPVYLAYVLAIDEDSAVGMNCISYDIDECTSVGFPVFEVHGNELSRGDTFTLPFEDGGCLLNQTTSFLLTDNGIVMSAEESATLTLTTIASGACTEIENDARARSTNGFGIEGCVFTRRITGVRSR